ncbi:MAG: hypothetical protein QXT53_02335 [Ignisphaera sp.]
MREGNNSKLTYFHVYTTILGVVLLQLYSMLLNNPNLSIFTYLAFHGFKVDSIQNYIIDSYLITASRFQKILVFVIASIILMSVDVVRVLKYNGQHQLLLEVLLYFIFTGDVVSTLVLFIIVASLLRILKPFFNAHRIEKESVNNVNNKLLLSDLFIAVGTTIIILCLEILFFRFITLLTTIVYLTLFTIIALAKFYQLSISYFLEILLISIPPFGLVILI